MTKGINAQIPLIVYNDAFVMDNLTGDIFYITCIDEPKKLQPLYDKYKNIFHCVYQVDIYTNDQWLEIMPPAASKSHAIKQLQSFLGCERVVAFGDGRNYLFQR